MKDYTATLRSISSEEMLHLSLAGNILKAIGGTPKLYCREIVPQFPGHLPFRTPELDLELAGACKEQIHKFVLVISPSLYCPPSFSPRKDRERKT
jgi:hypothetical protein